MVEIRPLTVEWYDALLKLWNGAGLAGVKPRGRDSRAETARQMERFPEGFLGAFHGDSLVGAVVATHDGRKGWINGLAVNPVYRCQGIARMLVKAAEALLRSNGVKVIGALTGRDNAGSLKLFEAMGYQIHEDVVYVSRRDSPND